MTTIFFQTASRRRLEKNYLFCNTSCEIHCKLEQKSPQNKSEISDISKSGDAVSELEHLKRIIDGA